MLFVKEFEACRQVLLKYGALEALTEIKSIFLIHFIKQSFLLNLDDDILFSLFGDWIN